MINVKTSYVYQKKNLTSISNQVSVGLSLEKKYLNDVNVDTCIHKRFSVTEQFLSRHVFFFRSSETKLQSILVIYGEYNKNSINFISFSSNLNLCFNDNKIEYNSDGLDLFPEKRKKRRRFQTEEERRVARILKNRRTAEESTQEEKEDEQYLLSIARYSYTTTTKCSNINGRTLQ